MASVIQGKDCSCERVETVSLETESDYSIMAPDSMSILVDSFNM